MSKIRTRLDCAILCSMEEVYSRRRFSWWKILLGLFLALLLAGMIAFVRQIYVYYKAIRAGESNPLFAQQLEASWRSQEQQGTGVIGDLADSNAPAMGPSTAPITIVAFVDYDCPFCQRSHAAWRMLAKDYPEAVRLIVRDFPIPELHPEAVRPSLAARCAQKQGKFWSFHDALYQSMDQRSEEQLIALATRVGLEREAFQRCLTSGETRALVERDVQDGIAAGVSGTPAFFFNGKKIEGAMDRRMFAAVIDYLLKQVFTK